MEIIAVLAGIIIALFSGWYTYRSYRHGREIASKGAKLKIGLYSAEAPNRLCILLPFNQKKLFFFPLILSIKNYGEISAKNAEVFITVTSAMCDRDVEKRISKIGVARGVKHASEEGRTEYLTDSYIKVGDIPPKTTFNIADEFIWNTETVIRRPLKATSKDGVDFTANILATFSLMLEVKIMHQDNKPIISYYSIEFRKFGENENLNEYIKREKKLLNELHEGSMQIHKNDNIKCEKIRVLTFGKYKQFDETMEPNKRKNSTSKIQCIRCDKNSIKYKDFMVYGNNFFIER